MMELERPEGARQTQNRILWRGKDVLLITGGIILIFALFWIAFQGYLSVTGVEPESLSSSVTFSILIGALEVIALAGSVYLFGLRRRGLDWDAVGLLPASGQWLAAGVAAGLLAIPLTALIASGVQLLLGQPLTNPQLEFLVPEGFSWFGAVGMFVMGGLLAPLAEEMFFRGVLYPWMRSRWGVWAGIVGSGLIFGAVHGEISISAATAVMGMGLAWLYERSGSLWPSILVHIINNAVKILLLYLLLAIDPAQLGL